MESRVEVAVEKFKSGLNCAQSVVGTYAPLFGVSEDEALRMSAGFGAGMGRLQHVCGALTGAFMVAGCKEGTTDPGDKEAKERTYALVLRMSKQFEQEHGSISCRELTDCDLNTEEGKKDFRDREVNLRVCRPCVRTAARMVEETILAEGKNP
jgi:C_GCAxxG_C_C family probable redox protein